MSEGRAAIPERLRAASDAWTRFWFAEQPTTTLTVFRVCLGLLTLAWAISFAFDLEALHSETGVLPEPRHVPYRISLLHWFTGDAALWAAYIGLLISASAVALGVAFRVAAPLLFVLVASFQFDNTLVLNSGDILIRIFCAYFALYALLTPGRPGGTPLLFRRRAGAAETVTSWPLRLVQIQMTLIYPFTVMDKFRGDSWLDGTAVLRALALVEFKRFSLPAFVEETVWVGNVLSYATLALEFSLPFLLWNNTTRRLAIVVGIGMHLSFDIPLRVGFFSWAMMLGYVAFVRPEEFQALGRILGRWWHAAIRLRQRALHPVDRGERVLPEPAAIGAPADADDARAT